MHDVYVFGDSHWRVFFPTVNHGAATDNVTAEAHGVRTIDTIANELSGATMWGLLNPKSKNGARNRILNTLDAIGGADNVALVFGEVDARYHAEKYFVDGHFVVGRAYELLARFARFIKEDLLIPDRVRGQVFVYTGFAYPLRGETLRQPGQPMGDTGFSMARTLNSFIADRLQDVLEHDACVMSVPNLRDEIVSDDGVHLRPELIYPELVEYMGRVLEGVG